MRAQALLAASLSLFMPMAVHAAPAAAADGIEYAAQAGDPAAARVEAMLPAAKARVEGFFGSPFAEPVRVKLAPDRAAFDASFPKAWGMGKTECWMVGVGVADFLVLLSPADWSKEACDHDATKDQAVRDIVTHELVHMYHGQHNPTRDFTGVDDLSWFIEGLAVLASGQLDRGHNNDLDAVLRSGAWPTSLAKVWTGDYRYGMAGSLVQYIDQTRGRKTVVALLSATSQARVLKTLGVSEAELLARWKAWAEARANPAKT
jgi:hypothetical protein